MSWRLAQVECMYDDIVACVVRAQHHMCYASACLHLARLEGILGTRAVHQNVCTRLRAGGNACACQLCTGSFDAAAAMAIKSAEVKAQHLVPRCSADCTRIGVRSPSLCNCRLLEPACDHSVHDSITTVAQHD